MISLTSVFVAAFVAAGAFASPTGPAPNALAERNTPSAQGTANGYLFQFYDDGKSGNTIYTNTGTGSYSVKWTGASDFTSGVGWRKATNRNIKFSGSISSTAGHFYVAVYTWSRSGENYILENYNYNPCNDARKATQKGTLTSDGSTYQVCLVDTGNNYLQNWSVRRSKRSSGTVTTANHYNYYNSKGMTHNPLSAADYQIFSTEGFGSASGSAAFTVSQA